MQLKCREKLIAAYIDACELEIQAFKPGNVSVYADGHDMTVANFRLSAQVSAQPLTNTDYGLGEKIYFAVKATRTAVHCNTNLGILLLCAPLIQVFDNYQQNLTLRENLGMVLQQTTVIDADWVFQAITLAAPGGLGASEQQDVNSVPEVSLTEAMQIASQKDLIALQYTNNYKEIFEIMILRYNHAFNRWGDRKWAATAVFTDFLSQFPDSHIERKYGKRFTDYVFSHISKLNNELTKSDRPEQMLPRLYEIDAQFKAKGVNPGTTADLTVATLFAAELEQLITVLA